MIDRSAHIIYRKRGEAFEITVRRSAIQAELQQLLSKLSMHRMSIADSYLVIIKGSKRVNLGRLSDMNLHQLLQLIDDCVEQYGTCGLEITEHTAGSGALYN